MSAIIFYTVWGVVAFSHIRYGINNTIIYDPSSIVFYENPQFLMEPDKYRRWERMIKNDWVAMNYVKNIYYLNGWKFSELHTLNKTTFIHFVGRYGKISSNYLVLEKLVTFNPSYPLIEDMLLPFDKTFFGHMSSALPTKRTDTWIGLDPNFNLFYDFFREGQLTKYTYIGQLSQDGRGAVRLLTHPYFTGDVVAYLDKLNRSIEYKSRAGLRYDYYDFFNCLVHSRLPYSVDRTTENFNHFNRQCEAFTIWYSSWAYLEKYSHFIQLYKLPPAISDTIEHGIVSIQKETFGYIKQGLSSSRVSTILNTPWDSSIITTVDFFESRGWQSLASSGKLSFLRGVGFLELADYICYNPHTRVARFWLPDELLIVREAKNCIGMLYPLGGLDEAEYKKELIKVITTISDAVINRKMDICLNYVSNSEPFSLPDNLFDAERVNN